MAPLRRDACGWVSARDKRRLHRWLRLFTICVRCRVRPHLKGSSGLCRHVQWPSPAPAGPRPVSDAPRKADRRTARLRGYPRGDGEGHGQWQRHDADGNAGSEIGSEILSRVGPQRVDQPWSEGNGKTHLVVSGNVVSAVAPADEKNGAPSCRMPIRRATELLFKSTLIIAC